MSTEAASSSSLNRAPSDQIEDEELMMIISGGGSGLVEPKTLCDHLDSISSDLSHIPLPDTPCLRCQHPAENWLCLCCKEVLCSRFVNKHMLQHYEQTGHCLALSYSDLSVWCFKCEAYLDAQVMQQLRLAHETAYILKFGEPPPARTADCILQADAAAGSSSSSS